MVHLAKHKIAFSKLNQHFFRGESVVKLQLEILYLLFSIGELYQSGLILSYVLERSDEDSRPGMDKAHLAHHQDSLYPSPSPQFVSAVPDPFLVTCPVIYKVTLVGGRRKIKDEQRCT